MFTKFIYLCAGRAAQILNINSLANDCGIDNKTAQSWLGILESSRKQFRGISVETLF